MAFTPPTVRGQGDLITPTIYDTDLVANIQWLFDNRGLCPIAYASNTVTANFSFLGIDQTYQHLLIKARLRSDYSAATSDTVNIRFNADSGSNYSFGYVSLANTTVSGVTTDAGSAIAFPTHDSHASVDALRFSPLEVEVRNYNEAVNHKTGYFRTSFGTDTTTASVRFLSGNLLWNISSPAAITSLTIAAVSGTGFVSGSEVLIMGFRGL